MATKRKADEAPLLSAPTWDVYGFTIPQPFNLPARRNPFRTGDKVAVFNGRVWQWVNVHSDEAKAFKRVLSGSFQSFRYYDVMLRQDLAAVACAVGGTTKVIQFPAAKVEQKAA
jgi:hypothetical protein